MRNCIKEYFLLRDELANAIEIPGSLGDNHNGKIIHTLLMRTEERFQLALNQIEKQIQHTEKQINELNVMIDRFYWEMMYHLVPVAESFENSATARANRQHHEWRKEVRKIIKGKQYNAGNIGGNE